MNIFRKLFDTKTLIADQELCNSILKTIIDRPLTDKYNYIEFMKTLGQAQKLGLTASYYNRHTKTKITFLNGVIVSVE